MSLLMSTVVFANNESIQPCYQMTRHEIECPGSPIKITIAFTTIEYNCETGAIINHTFSPTGKTCGGNATEPVYEIQP